MMFTKSRIALFTLLITVFLLLTGCVGSFGADQVAAVDSSVVSTAMHYVDGSTKGPVYNVSLAVPDAWVGQFTTRNVGNTVTFSYTPSEGESKLIFTIEALSPTQYWQASGSYPASQTNIVNLSDTYFVYHLPIDTFYSGLSQEQFLTFAEAVPDIVASFSAVAAE